VPSVFLLRDHLGVFTQTCLSAAWWLAKSLKSVDSVRSKNRALPHWS